MNENNYNLLYFENNDIDPRQFFAEQRRLAQIGQANPNENKGMGGVKKIIPLNNCSNNIDNISLGFPEPEDEETKNKKEVIIQKMKEKTDDIRFEKNFDIFDYSKMDLDISESCFFEENEQTININDNNNSMMTYYTSPNNTDKELIRKRKNKNKNIKKRIKFKRVKKEKSIDKSYSIRKKRKEILSSRSNSSFSDL